MFQGEKVVSRLWFCIAHPFEITVYNLFKQMTITNNNSDSYTKLLQKAEQREEKNFSST